MKKVIAIIGVLFGVIVALVLARALMFGPPDPTQRPPLDLPSTTVNENLAKSLTFPTISGDGFRAEPFSDLQAWMAATYPRFHAVTSLQRFE